MTVFDVFDPEDVSDGYMFVDLTDDGSSWEDPFDDAEVWLASQDVPDFTGFDFSNDNNNERVS